MNIDFVEPALPSRRAWILASLPAVLGLLLLCVLVHLHTRLEKQRERLATAVLAAKAHIASPTVHRHVPVYQAEAFAAVTRAALPEADALAEVEHVEVTGIQLRSIDVNPAQGLVTIELDAASDEALDDYLDQLNAGNEPQKWHIQKLAATKNEARANAPSMSAGFQTSGSHAVTIARRL
ncbi:MAG: hypothetical protein M3N82_05545 [Pseudomonadota bacterium]|nr:hypothetical protein [Pseudomonadota bacterium]